METKTTIIDAMNAVTDIKAGKDKQVTNVVFLMEQQINDWETPVFAFFPNEDYNSDGLKMSYSHIGQHSACSNEYARDCKLATPEQYNDLKAELDGIGYNLNILKSI